MCQDNWNHYLDLMEKTNDSKVTVQDSCSQRLGRVSVGVERGMEVIQNMNIISLIQSHRSVGFGY